MNLPLDDTGAALAESSIFQWCAGVALLFSLNLAVFVKSGAGCPEFVPVIDDPVRRSGLGVQAAAALQRRIKNAAERKPGGIFMVAPREGHRIGDQP
jgi:hypothetical protein